MCSGFKERRVFLLASCLFFAACCISGCGDECSTGPGTPRVIHVRADGEGEFCTIRVAVDHARDGDIIELADGVYSGKGNTGIDFLGKAIKVRSASAFAEACTIDCRETGDIPVRAFWFHSGEGANSIVENITIVNGYAEGYGGGILCEDDSSPTLRGLHIADCAAGHHGGGLCLRSDSRSVVESCSFVSNRAGGGGGVSCIGTSARILDSHFEANVGGLGGGLELYLPGKEEVRVERCTFVNNNGGSGGSMFFQHVRPTVTECSSSRNYGDFGGAVFCHEASPILIRCTSFRDTTDQNGASLHCQTDCEPEIISCTFSHGHSMSGSSGSLVHLTDGSKAAFSRCILTFCEKGMAVNCTGSGSLASITCSNIFGNALGDWTGCIANQSDIQGNISADPLFCDPAAGDLHLRAASPCRSDSSSCGLMGALPVRCW